jgi:NAD(P)-dependent dehydrogenase (short-subunit alcohol dehydrogenase family)
MKVALAARRLDNLKGLAQEVGGHAFTCDSTDRTQVAKLFADVEAAGGAPDVVVYNASYRTRGPFIDLDPVEVERSIAVTVYGGFLVAQQAAKRMVPKGHGAIMLTGASAGVKGYPLSAPFAMGKFALRGLAQSMARELQPQGIHVAHIVVDGGILSPRRPNPPDKPDAMLDPDAIAQSYLDLLRQHRSAWAWEIELRPWMEKF